MTAGKSIGAIAMTEPGAGSSCVKLLCNFQTVQHKLAELKTEICVGRAFVDNCLQLLSEKRLDPSTASMAKFWAFADSRVQPIYGGTNEIMKELIARGIVSQK
ncbi:hypothetical protein GOODEAATRI_000889 [Goodea atripinnis]|uniref:Acyl-CoA dehydrogenase/oxidase C-terminal domain-containing protein n=1 Tax=Goodea atripinnis TaxID=208336 RepID=A0ABV0P0F1_9TELE